MIPTALLALAVMADPPPRDARLYELRVYTAQPGKVDAVAARFRDAAVPLFAKHGMTGLGYFLPDQNPDGQFYALLSHADRAARDGSFKAFAADPAWTAALAESERNGKLVAKVDEYFLVCTDYSPVVKVEAADPPRVFELRKYRSTSGNPTAINARFRDHTVKLFARHGMTNLWYWNLATGTADTTHDLIYLLAHLSADARTKAFDAFRKDPDWTAARLASEAAAGGSLTTKDGVVSVMLKPTAFSPLR